MEAMPEAFGRTGLQKHKRRTDSQKASWFHNTVERVPACLVRTGSPALRRRLHHGGHRALGTGQAPVRAVGVNLVAREFGLGAFAGDQYRAPAAVHLLGMPVGLLQREYKDLL